MQLIVTILILFHGGLFYHYVIITKSLNRYIFPGSIFYLSILANFPMRAALLISNDEFNQYNITTSELADVLIYSSLFLLCFNMALSFITNQNIKEAAKRGQSSTSKANAGGKNFFVLQCLFFLYMAAFVWRVYTGKFNGLWYDISDLYQSTSDNLMLMPDTLKWAFLALAVGMISTCERKRITILLEIAAVTSAVLFEAVVSTSKAPLAFLFLLYLFWISENKKRVSVFAVSIFIAVFIGFGMYSYLTRQQGYRFVRESFRYDAFVETVGKVNKLSDSSYEASSRKLLDRFNYLDGVVLCMRRRDFIDNSTYRFGSAVDVFNLVPRYVWPDRPYINFNYHLTSEVWNQPQPSESPIGRVGEAFYVAGFYGCFYGLIYAVVFYIIYEKLYCGSLVLKSIFFWILIVNTAPDNYLFYKIKDLCYLAPAMYVLCRFSRVNVKTRSVVDDSNRLKNS